MDYTNFQQCQKANVMQSVKKLKPTSCWFSQQDSKYTSKYTIKYFKKCFKKQLLFECPAVPKLFENLFPQNV